MNEPTTAAGRALCSDLDDFEGWDPTIVQHVLAIEAEARAAALDEARAAVADCSIELFWREGKTPLAAIDALREDAHTS